MRIVGGGLFFKLPVPRGVGNLHFESNKKVLYSVAEGTVSYKLVIFATLRLIQSCGIFLRRLRNEYLQKFSPLLILDFENGYRNRFKIKGNIILKVQILREQVFRCGCKLSIQIRVSYCYCCFQVNEYNSKNRELFKSL